MKLKIFSVFDSKVMAFTNPFFQRTPGEAVRAFTDEVNKQGSQIGKYAEDYTLFMLGEWDDSNASFDLLDTPQSLGVAIQFRI